MSCLVCKSKEATELKDSRGRFVCSRCWALVNRSTDRIPESPFFENAAAENKFTKYIHIHMWHQKYLIIFIFVAAFGYKACSDIKYRRKSTTTDYVKLNSYEKNSSLTPQRVPETGVFNSNVNLKNGAPLKITTSLGSNYFIKLVNIKTEQVAMTIFIRGGEVFDGSVPLGEYSLRYATGEIWFGLKHYFGQETRYSEASKAVSFSQKGRRLLGNSIKLYKVRNGNLPSRSIKAGEF